MIDSIWVIQTRAKRINIKSKGSLDKSKMLMRLVLSSSSERMLELHLNIGELTKTLGHATHSTEEA